MAVCLGQVKIYLPGIKHDDVHKSQPECRRAVSIDNEVYNVCPGKGKLIDRVDKPRKEDHSR